MDGFEFVALIETELKRIGMPKGEFYAKSGISSATLSQWRKRIYSPSSDAIRKVEAALNIELAIGQKEKPTLSGELSDARKQLDAALDDMSDEELLFLMSKIKAIKEMRE